MIDRAPAGYEGPWVTFARMDTLRSPKQLAGPALGLPALTFRAWFEAQYGRDAWDALYKIPRTQWMDYLRWYRRVLDLQVRNDTTLVALRPRDDGLLALDVRGNGEAQTLLARHVVLATGRDESAAPTYRPSRNARRARAGPIRPSRSISRRSRASESAWSARARPRSTTRAPRSKPAPRASTCSSAARTFRASTS